MKNIIFFILVGTILFFATDAFPADADEKEPLVADAFTENQYSRSEDRQAAGAELVISSPVTPWPPGFGYSPYLPSEVMNAAAVSVLSKPLGSVFAPRCGNGAVEAFEECDDGNNAGGDGCSATCKLEFPELCGNGRIDPGEQCDPGFGFQDPGCSSTCQIVGRCGNGILEPGEECDSEPGCSPLCRWESLALAAEAEAGRRRSAEPETSTTTTSLPAEGPTERMTGSIPDCNGESCTGPGEEVREPVALCGNGRIDAEEECDDGNMQSGDGCSSNCKKEVPCRGRYLPPGTSCPKEDDLLQGRAVTSFSGCEGVCFVKPVRDPEGNIIATVFLPGESYITGGTYQAHGGTFLCVNGAPESKSGEQLVDVLAQSQSPAEVVGCII